MGEAVPRRVRWMAAIYAVHRWCGLVTGWLLFAICLTGTLVVFKYPLKVWANPALVSVPAADHYGPDRALAAFRAAWPQAPVRLLAFPADDYSIHQYSFAVRQPSGAEVRAWLNPATGELAARLPSDFADFVQRLHAGLFMGRTGRWIVGALGVLMAVSLVSGVLFHWRRLGRDLFALRLAGDVRRAWSDVHKLSGVWLLVFHLLIALTGAWLGLETLLRAPGPAPLTRLGAGHAEPASIARLTAAARAAHADLTPTHVNFAAFGAAGSSVRVQGRLPGGALVQHGQTMVVLDAVEAVPLAVVDRRREGWGVRLLAMMRPLHYGYFGGVWSGALYLLFGLASTALVWSGLAVWAERDRRQRHRGAPPPRGSAMERANVAVIGGLMLVLTAFALATALAQVPAAAGWFAMVGGFAFAGSHDLLAGRALAPELGLFFAAWLGVGAALGAAPVRSAWRWTLRLLATGLALLPLASALAAGGVLADWRRGAGEAAGVAVVALLLAVACLAALRRQSSAPGRTALSLSPTTRTPR